MPQQLREATRVARKVHYCGMCGGVIKIGERHHVSTNVYDGRVYDWRTCEGCDGDNIVNEVYFWAGHPDEGVDIESASEWAHEHVSGHDAARRWLARSGCKCERCESRLAGES
jgi:hypothetical protein